MRSNSRTQCHMTREEWPYPKNRDTYLTTYMYILRNSPAQLLFRHLTADSIYPRQLREVPLGEFRYLAGIPGKAQIGGSQKTSCKQGADQMNGHHGHFKTVELRNACRYHLQAPVFFVWSPKHGPVRNGQGVTRDINTFGVYVQTDELPPAGALVQMDIMLPRLASEGPGMHLTGEGTVVRVEPSGVPDQPGTQSGFAASVQFYPDLNEVVLSHLKILGRVV